MRGMLRSRLPAVVMTLLLVVVFVGLRLAQGGLDRSAYARIADINGNGTITASHFNDPQDSHVELDMMQDVAGTWCNPVDSVRTVTVGHQYSVAVCLTTAPLSPVGFQFELGYNPAFNDCVDWPGSSFDSNPDANLGLTKWDGTTPITINGLGTGWDCNVGGTSPPTCANLEGRASLKCKTVSGTSELPFGWDVSEPLAVVTLRALAPGYETLSLWNVEVDEAEAQPFINCFPNDVSYCEGGLDVIITPTSTVTPTRSPSSTPTPHGVGGMVMLPPSAVADASSGTSGRTGPTAATWIALAGAVAAAFAASGWYARSRRTG